MSLSPNPPESRAMGGTEHIFMLGVGGAGMSGIAEVLAQLGYRVSGSDRQDSAVVSRLRSLGIEVHIGHRAANIEGAEVLVISCLLYTSPSPRDRG